MQCACVCARARNTSQRLWHKHRSIVNESWLRGAFLWLHIQYISLKDSCQLCTCRPVPPHCVNECQHVPTGGSGQLNTHSESSNDISAHFIAISCYFCLLGNLQKCDLAIKTRIFHSFGCYRPPIILAHETHILKCKNKLNVKTKFILTFYVLLYITFSLYLWQFLI